MCEEEEEKKKKTGQTHSQTVPVGTRKKKGRYVTVCSDSPSPARSVNSVCKSCYLEHDAPGSTRSHQICLPLPVGREENPQETPALIGCMKHRSRGSTAMYVRSL